MAGRLEGKNAVVTGSGRGIGRAVALLLASEGANVVVNDPGVNLDGSGSDAGPAQQVVDEIKAAGGNAVANLDSVAELEGGENMIKQCVDTFGRLDILINVAGILRDRMVFNMSEEEWEAVIRTHLYGHFNTIKPASILMRQQRGGRIVNFSSISGLQGGAGQANYGSAKGGIAGLTRVIARDLGRYGVTCNAIAPGAQTRMTQSVPDSARQLRARAGIAQGSSGGALGAAGGPVELRQPEMPQLNDAEHVAPMTVWLCTPEAWNVNGKIFHVAGGTIGLAMEEVPANTINKDSMWTIDELASLVPGSLMRGIQNPAPPAPDVDLPYRPAAAPPAAPAPSA
jgi:NAD(P)-dependent dehydrogenase (short-subunit alcohol dehydrogenase family)